MAHRLAGKIALITGAAQGIGKACAELFAKEGAFVFVSDINDDLGIKTAHGIGSQAQYLHLDVQNENDWHTAIQQIIKEKKHLDILVNNAGITGFQEGFGLQDPENASLDSWRKVHAVNSDGVFLGCQKAIQKMKHAKGSIVNISSNLVLLGFLVVQLPTLLVKQLFAITQRVSLFTAVSKDMIFAVIPFIQQSS